MSDAMGQLLQRIGLAVITLVTYIAFRSWMGKNREMRQTRLRGCEPPVTVHSWDKVFGLDLFAALIKADARGRRSEFYRSLHRTHGATFEMKAVSTSLQIAHPENIKAICTSSFGDFGVGPMRGRIGVPFIDRGIFTEDGEFWKHSRALVRPTFSRAEIADLRNFERHSRRFLNTIPKDSSTFDLLPLVKRMFLDSSTEFLFGESTDSQMPESSAAADDFMAAFDRSLLGLALLLITGPLRWPLYLDPAWKKAYAKVHAFVDAHVQRALERKRSGKIANDNAGASRYVLLEEMTAFTEDPYELRMQIINVFFPARDTAAIAFSDVIFELARHPHEWSKLRTEVLSIEEPLSFESLKSLPCARAIINEALRLHPATSKVGRTCLADTVLPCGGGPTGEAKLFVPKGRVIDMDLYTLQRNPDIWGDDADEFRPSRWDEGRPLWEARWEYEPFLGGVRMCPAQNQVLTQLTYLLVRFAQRFEKLENRDPVLEYFERVAMTVESRNGVRIAVQSAVTSQ